MLTSMNSVSRFFCGELLEVDRCADADRQADDESDEQRQQRADESTADAGELGLAAVAGGEEQPVEMAFDGSLAAQLLEPGDLLVRCPTVGGGRVEGEDAPFTRLGRRGRAERNYRLAPGQRLAELGDLDEAAIDGDENADGAVVERLVARRCGRGRP